MSESTNKKIYIFWRGEVVWLTRWRRREERQQNDEFYLLLKFHKCLEWREYFLMLSFFCTSWKIFKISWTCTTSYNFSLRMRHLFLLCKMLRHYPVELTSMFTFRSSGICGQWMRKNVNTRSTVIWCDSFLSYSVYVHILMLMLKMLVEAL